jgi:cell division protein FtsB
MNKLRELWHLYEHLIITVFVALFVVYYVFLSDYDLVTRWKLGSQIAKMEQRRDSLQSKNTEDEALQEALLNSDETLETFAREELLMKKENEDLFIVESGKLKVEN